MKVTTWSSVVASVCILGLAATPSARAQDCTLGLPAGVQSALDSCLRDRHDSFFVPEP